jgi:nucleoside-triphosphatase THEP1
MLVDELGHLELRGEGFAQVLELVWTGKSKTYVLVIRSELLPRFLPKLPLKYLTFEVTISNRDKLPKEIGSVLLQELR